VSAIEQLGDNGETFRKRGNTVVGSEIKASDNSVEHRKLKLSFFKERIKCFPRASGIST